MVPFLKKILLVLTAVLIQVDLSAKNYSYLEYIYALTKKRNAEEPGSAKNILYNSYLQRVGLLKDDSISMLATSYITEGSKSTTVLDELNKFLDRQVQSTAS